MTKQQQIRQDLTIAFLQWHVRRYANYAKNLRFTQAEALNYLRRLPSFEERKREMDRYVDPEYRFDNRPDQNIQEKIYVKLKTA
jgi:hypothetical protein